MGENARPKLDTETHFTTPEEISGYLSLKLANGMSLSDVLGLHTRILTRIGRDYVKVWGSTTGQTDAALYRELRDGAYYTLSYLEDDDEWYVFGPKDEL